MTKLTSLSNLAVEKHIANICSPATCYTYKQITNEFDLSYLSSDVSRRHDSINEIAYFVTLYFNAQTEVTEFGWILLLFLSSFSSLFIFGMKKLIDIVIR